MKDWMKVESVLFGSGKYLTEEEIAKLSGVPKKSLKHALTELKKHYKSIESSLDVFNQGDSWKLNVKEEFSGIVKNVISEAEMPRAIMETLALIAYKSPVLQSEIIDRRGTGAYDHISFLEEKGFISREKSGRSFKLRTSPKFFDYFDVEGDSNLKKMFKEVKAPETLGNLEVYASKDEGEQEVEFSDKILERMKKLESTPSDHEEKKKFLDDFESKYSKAKTNIDETDKEMNEFRKVEPKQPLEWNDREEKEEAPVEEPSEPGNPEDILKKLDKALESLDNASAKKDDEYSQNTEENEDDNKEDEQENSEEDLPEEQKTVEEEKKQNEKKTNSPLNKSASNDKKSEKKKEVSSKNDEKKETSHKSQKKPDLKNKKK